MTGEHLRIRVQGDVFELDFGALTWGELGELEDMLGTSLEDANFATARGVLALAFIAVRKKQPLVTLESLKALPMSEIEVVDEPDPTVAVQDGADDISGSQS